MKFPVLVLFQNDLLVYAATEIEQLKVASVSNINKYEGAKVFDSDGEEFRISKPYKLGWATNLLGYNFLFNRRTAKIDFEINQASKQDLIVFKNILMDRIDKKFDRHFYFDLDLQELKDMIIKADSFYMVINIFLRGNLA